MVRNIGVRSRENSALLASDEVGSVSKWQACSLQNCNRWFESNRNLKEDQMNKLPEKALDELSDMFHKLVHGPSISRQLLRPRPVKKGRKKS